MTSIDIALAGEIAGGDLGGVVAELAGQILDDAHADAHVVVWVVDALTRLGVPLKGGGDDLHAAVGAVDAGAGIRASAGFLLVDGLDHRLEMISPLLRDDGDDIGCPLWRALRLGLGLIEETGKRRTGIAPGTLRVTGEKFGKVLGHGAPSRNRPSQDWPILRCPELFDGYCTHSCQLPVAPPLCGAVSPCGCPFLRTLS